MAVSYGYRKGSIKIIFDGQSFNFAPDVANSYPRLLMAQLPKLYRGDEVAVGGTPYINRAGTAAKRTDSKMPLNGDTCLLLDNGGQTDIYQLGMNLTAAQTIADMESYWNARFTAGADYIIVATVTKSTVYDADGETQRQALNTAILASSVPDAVVDLASLPHAADPNDTTYFYDGLHPTAAFAAEIATGYKNAIQSLGFPV